jgi:iron(III) transport system permease protein
MRTAGRVRVEIAGTVLLLLVLLLTVYPLGMLLWGSVRSAGPGLPGELTLDGYINAYTDIATYRTWANSFMLATAVTLLSTLLAVMFAFIATRTDVPLRGLLVPVMTLSFIMPAVFLSLSWALLGHPRAGLLNQLSRQLLGIPTIWDSYSWQGMILVMSLSGVAFKFLLLVGAFKAMDMALEEASRMAGASRRATLVRVGLPILAPTILGVMALSFIRALQASETPLFLGFPARIYVFSTRIIDYLTNYVPARFPEAGALAMTGVLVMLGLVLLQWRVLGNREFITITGKGYRPDIWHLGRVKYVLSALIVLYILLALVMPGIQLVLGSIQRIFGVYSWQGLTLANYLEAISSPVIQRAARNTLLISAAGGLIAMLVTMGIAYVVARTRYSGRRVLDLAVWAPWTMPGVVLGIGVLWAYISIPGLRNMYGTPWLLLVGVVVTVIPVGVRVMAGTLGQLSYDLEEVARIHGAPWWRTFRSVVFPLILPSFMYGWLVVAVIISGELSVPLILYSPGNEVLTVAVYDLQQNRREGVAAAVFSMMLIAAAGALGLTRLIQLALAAYRRHQIASMGASPESVREGRAPLLTPSAEGTN